MNIDGVQLGAGFPSYIVAEVGINHNGDLETAKALVDVAHQAGCQAVKFQKRTPEISTPDSQKELVRETPWGKMTYLAYKKRIELSREDYAELASHAQALGLSWFASPWDVPSVQFLQDLSVPAIKIASACITDERLLLAARKTGKPIVMSTGMSTLREIEKAVDTLGKENLILLHSTSAYPLEADEANLQMIDRLREKFSVPVGYSGHERGLQISIAAVALGAIMIERHITLDRSMWGTDQSASLEPAGLSKLVRDIRTVELAMGDGEKRVYESELAPRSKLRRFP